MPEQEPIFVNEGINDETETSDNPEISGVVGAREIRKEERRVQIQGREDKIKDLSNEEFVERLPQLDLPPELDGFKKLMDYAKTLKPQENAEIQAMAFESARTFLKASKHHPEELSNENAERIAINLRPYIDAYKPLMEIIQLSNNRGLVTAAETCRRELNKWIKQATNSRVKLVFPRNNDSKDNYPYVHVHRASGYWKSDFVPRTSLLKNRIARVLMPGFTVDGAYNPGESDLKTGEYVHVVMGDNEKMISPEEYNESHPGELEFLGRESLDNLKKSYVRGEIKLGDAPAPRPQAPQSPKTSGIESRESVDKFNELGPLFSEISSLAKTAIQQQGIKENIKAWLGDIVKWYGQPIARDQTELDSPDKIDQVIKKSNETLETIKRYL